MSKTEEEHDYISEGGLNYFDGLRFVNWADEKKYTVWNRRKYFRSYVLQYNHAGELNYQFPGQKMTKVIGPHAWITFPEHGCVYGPGEELTRHHMFVGFLGPRVEVMLKKGLIKGKAKEPVMFPITRPERFYSELQILFKCIGPDLHSDNLANVTEGPKSLAYPHIENAPQAVNVLESLLLQMQQQPTGTSVGPMTKSLQALAMEVRKAPQLDWDFAIEAERLGISLHHFRHIFPQCIGIPPDRYLRECRLDYAARLLRESEDRVADIAIRSGIPDLHHFTKLFKTHHSITPGVYRRSYRV